MNSRSQQTVVDAITASVLLMAGAVLVAAGRLLVEGPVDGDEPRTGDSVSQVLGTISAHHPARIDTLLGLISCAAGLLVLAWWLTSMTFAVVAALLTAAGRTGAARWAGAISPAFMRRLALSVLGMSLIAGPAAHAAPEPPDPAWHPTVTAPVSPASSIPPSEPSSPSALPSVAATSSTPPQSDSSSSESGPSMSQPSRGVADPGWTPSTLESSPGPLFRSEPRPTALGHDAVEVLPGDSLWRIVARYLGPGATELDVAKAWPLWFESNRTVIGENPDLIRPGQLLHPPIP